MQSGEKFATTKEYISTENVDKIVASIEVIGSVGGIAQIGVYFFDEAKVYVSNIGDYISTGNASYPPTKEIEIPANAAYFRITTADKATIDGTHAKVMVKYSVYML